MPESLFQALSDTTRLRILALLAAEDELCVCDLTRVLKLSQPMVSRHLAFLREVGVVRDRRAGLWVHYRLHPDLPSWARKVLKATLAGMARHEPRRADRRARRPAVNRRHARCV